jgi:MFS family permease
VLDPVAGHLCDEYGPRLFVAGGFLFCGPSLIMLGSTTIGVGLFAFYLTLFGIFTTFVFAPVLAELSSAVDDEEKKFPGQFGKGKGHGQVYALFNVAYSIGTVVGPLQAGSTHSTHGWEAVALSLGVISLAMVIPSLLFTGGITNWWPDDRLRYRQLESPKGQ